MNKLRLRCIYFDKHDVVEVHVQHTPSMLYSDVAKRTSTEGKDGDSGRGLRTPATSCDEGGNSTGSWIDSWQAPRVRVVRKPRGTAYSCQNDGAT